MNLPSKKVSFSVSVAAGMGLLLMCASGASADSFTVTGSDSDGPVSVDLGERWPARLVATGTVFRCALDALRAPGTTLSRREIALFLGGPLL